VSRKEVGAAPPALLTTTSRWPVLGDGIIDQAGHPGDIGEIRGDDQCPSADLTGHGGDSLEVVCSRAAALSGLAQPFSRPEADQVRARVQGREDRG